MAPSGGTIVRMITPRGIGLAFLVAVLLFVAATGPTRAEDLGDELIEEHWEVWEDFGADAVTLERLRRVVDGKPRFGAGEVRWACGTCLRRAA
jgi:hypothetical protein